MKCFLCDPGGFNPQSDFQMSPLVSFSLTVVSADKGSRPGGARDDVHQQVPRSRRHLGLEIETPSGPMINSEDDHWSGPREAPEAPDAPEAPPGPEVPRSRRNANGHLGLEIETPTGPMINPEDDHKSGPLEAPESPEAPEGPPGPESRELPEAPEAPEAPSSPFRR